MLYSNDQGTAHRRGCLLRSACLLLPLDSVARPGRFHPYPLRTSWLRMALERTRSPRATDRERGFCAAEIRQRPKAGTNRWRLYSPRGIRSCNRQVQRRLRGIDEPFICRCANSDSTTASGPPARSFRRARPSVDRIAIYRYHSCRDRCRSSRGDVEIAGNTELRPQPKRVDGGLVFRDPAWRVVR